MNHHSEDKNTGISTPSDQHNSIYSEPLFVNFSTATPEQRKGFANLKNLPGSLLKRSLNFSLCCDFIYRKDMHRFNGMWIPYPIEYTHILPRSNLVQLFKRSSSPLTVSNQRRCTSNSFLTPTATTARKYLWGAMFIKPYVESFRDFLN